MTAYIVISLLLCAAFVSFAFIRKRNKDKLKLLCVVDSSLALFGGVLCLVSYLLMRSALSSSNGTFAEWLGDMVKVFCSIDIPVFAVLILAVFIPAFLSWADKKLRTGFSYAIRQAASVFAPAWILLRYREKQHRSLRRIHTPYDTGTGSRFPRTLRRRIPLSSPLLFYCEENVTFYHVQSENHRYFCLSIDFHGNM